MTGFHADPLGDWCRKVVEQTDARIHGDIVVSFKDVARL